MSNSVDTSHKSILKATGIFGFVQLVKIVLGIVSIKIVAVYLGVSGIGQLGLLQSVISLIAAVSGFGLQTIVVREISLNYQKQNYATILNVLHNWAFYVGIIGFLLFLITAPFFITDIFDEFSLFWIFLLAIQFVFSSVSSFRAAVLQGTQQFKILAFSQVISAIILSVLSMILYYFLGSKAIVYVLFANSFIGFFIQKYFTSEIKLMPDFLTFGSLKSNIKPYFITGTLFSVNIIFGYLCALLVKYFLKETTASTEIVGFYEVATTIMISYVGLVFSSMASDFYPKLTSIAHLQREASILINNQIQIALLLVVPIVVFLYSFGNQVLSLFYSPSFLPVFAILKIGLFSVVLKAITWPLGFYLLAVGNTKRYFKQELMSDFLNVSLSILGYYYFGLLGLGIAMALNFTLYGMFISYIMYAKYGFRYDNHTLNSIGMSLSITMLAMLVTLCGYASYWLLPLFVIASVYSVFQIHKKIDLGVIIKKLKSKF